MAYLDPITGTKFCGRCGKLKLGKDFHRNKGRKDGLRNDCKTCTNIRSRRFRQDHLEQVKNTCARWYHANKEYANIRSREWFLNNKDKHRTNSTKWRKDNLEKARESHRRYEARFPERKLARARAYQLEKLKATPPWAKSIMKDFMEYAYRRAKTLEAQTGYKYHLDHIVPVRGKNFRGLHVPWNIQILKATDNLSKGNKLVLEEVGSLWEEYKAQIA